MRTTALAQCVLLPGLAAGLLGGCAGYSVREEATGRDGYVVYEPEPYLLQTPLGDKAGRLVGWNWQVVWLPNRARSYRVRTWSGLGKADFKFTFEQGWMLTGLHDKGDNTALLRAFAPFLEGAAAGLERAGEDVAPVRPLLLRIDFDACGRVCGLTPVEPGDAVLRDCALPTQAASPGAAPPREGP